MSGFTRSAKPDSALVLLAEFHRLFEEILFDPGQVVVLGILVQPLLDVLRDGVHDNLIELLKLLLQQFHFWVGAFKGDVERIRHFPR